MSSNRKLEPAEPDPEPEPAELAMGEMKSLENQTNRKSQKKTFKIEKKIAPPSKIKE